MSSPQADVKRWPMVAALLVGVGLALAPVGFQMFDRAPKGGEMLDEFEPYMTAEEIDEFRGHLAVIGTARDEVVDAGHEDDAAALGTLAAEWAAIDADMTEMLDSMDDNLSEYEGVAALPPFMLFPWFFVLPGVILAGIAVWGLRHPGKAGPRTAVIVLGVGLLVAPAVFQMFTRAPGGQRMIADFEPMMTRERVTSVQGYFLTIGSAEGVLRRQVLPAAEADSLPAARSFVDAWPAMSADMAPMIGTMSDNVDNFAAVNALPPFGLFPWFFVLPGLIVIGLAVAAGRGRLDTGDAEAESTDSRLLEGATP